jgi:ferredoxin-NADP reductase
VPSYEATLKGREPVALGTMAFRFEKPAGFSFRPGQSVSLALLEPPPEPNGARRTFSLTSAPSQDELVVATRMREASAYKRALGTLPVGAKVRLTGPLGAMTLHEDGMRPAVFIAGGIGITPFLSMLRQAAHDRLTHRLLLLYSNRRPQDAAFLPDLQALERTNENFRLQAIMTANAGRISGETVKRFVGGIAHPVYYLAGPPSMVEGLTSVLKRIGVTDDDLQSEEFYGY